MAKGERLERAASKGLLAAELAGTGAIIGGMAGSVPGAMLGATVGAVAGLIVGDGTMVFMAPMVAIPAHEYSAMLNGTPPSTQVYIHAGEVLSQVQPTESQETVEVMEAVSQKKKRKKLNAYQRFTKQFGFRSKRKSETSKAYFAARSKALSRAWKKEKRGGK